MPPAAVMLACTHTHGGPASLSLRTWGRPHPGYAELLRRAAVGAATDAVAARRPARLGAGTTTCPGVAKNRTSYGNGLTDDTLGVLKVEDAAGRPLAVVVNYACHPVNLHSSGMLTADYPARIESAVQASLGCDVPGELFVTYGRQIRGTVGIAHTLVATKANGSLGYFPTPAAYAAGKYEALICPRWLGLQPFEPDCGERVFAAALRLRDRLAGVRTP